MTTDVDNASECKKSECKGSAKGVGERVKVETRDVGGGNP